MGKILQNYLKYYLYSISGTCNEFFTIFAVSQLFIENDIDSKFLKYPEDT